MNERIDKVEEGFKETMKKLEAKFFETNNDESEYINELKAEPLLENFDINNDNYIDFANALRGWKNCQCCKGLDECKIILRAI